MENIEVVKEKDVKSALKHLKPAHFITIIGRSAAGIPVEKIETIVEFDNNPIVQKIFDDALHNGKLIKTLLDQRKIKSLVILDDGTVHPSTFHFSTLKDRCSPYIPVLTTIGCDKGGINGNKIRLIINYKYETAKAVTDELFETHNVVLLYEQVDRTKSLLCMDSGNVYPSTFNYRTIQRRFENLDN